MNKMTRRDFTRNAAAAGLTTAVSSSRILGANDRVRLGFIALGNRGDQVLSAFLTHKDCEVTAICDLYQPYLDFASKKIGTSPRQAKDYRQLLEMKDVDAVVISTPDHWHALQVIHACQAGKDVYIEKPLSLCVEEGRKMVLAASRYKRVTQVGLQRRSSKFVSEAAEIVRTGGIGKVTAVRAFHIQNEWPTGIGNPKEVRPPAELDWEQWLGPAPRKPYNRNRTFYRFRWFWDYSGGQLTNFGVHYMDVIQWALGENAPAAVTAMGGRFAGMQDNREIPDTLEVLWTYPKGTLVTFSQFNANSQPAGVNSGQIEFRGTTGTLYLQNNGYLVVPEETRKHDFPVNNPVDRAGARPWRTELEKQIEPSSGKGDGDATALHARNFLDCIKSRARTNCDLETGHRSTSGPLIGNIAYRMKAYLEWDGPNEKFTNNNAANRMLRYAYRAPYKFPDAI
ncbi:MAG: Gfo/Idh/MocA family oxidoreductase [Acidobacteriota bacterium]|nr:MAG: Gfo/Idh/MocA family oxidoreductase [Acidobacteriota bacterium]